MALPTAPVIILFSVAVLTNIGALSTLPLTQGFSKATPTLICISLFIVNIFLLAKIIHSGTSLSGLVPLMSGLLPLSMIVVGVLFYGENASLSRIAMLVGACVLIFAASAVENRNSINKPYDATAGKKQSAK